MLSKVFNTTFSGLFRIQPSILSSNFTFCTSSGQRYESHPLKNKIMGLSTFEQFNTFFREKKAQFDPSCYSMASRTLAKILIDSRLTLNFSSRELIKAYLTNLQQVDIEALSLQQFSQFLYLLRIIKLDPNNSNAFVGNFIKQILEKSNNKLKELELENNLNRLSYFYQQYSSLGAKQASVLARRINILLHTNNSEVEFQHLTINEINLILKGMRSKQQISNDEKILLKNIVKTIVQKYFDNLSFFELAQISVGINEIIASSVNDIVPISLVEKIHRKVLSNIDEMDEKSIMYILNGKKTNNRTYNQIYKIIFQKVMDEIQPNGESSFNELFTLRLFNGISDKIRLLTTTTQNQDKFFTFFRLTLTKNPRFIHSFLENYIRRGFFNYKHILTIQEILESIPEFNFRLSLLHLLVRRNINIEKIINFDRLKEFEMKDRNLVMMISIMQSMAQYESPNKQTYTQFFNKLKDRFFELYKVEDQTFSRLIFTLDSELVSSLFKALRKQIQTQLPNPLETQQPQKYRAAWLKLYVYGNVQLAFLKKYSNVFKQKLIANDLDSLFRFFFRDEPSNSDSISNLLTLVSKRMDLVLQSNYLLSNLTRLMTLEVGNIFESGNSELLRNRYWQIIHECLDKAQPGKFFSHFSVVINLILKSSNYAFRYSAQYQTFLMKIFQKTQFLKNKYILSDILDECLKLNLIRRIDISNLSQDLMNITSPSHKLMLKMIETNEFILQDVELNKNNLHLFLYNLSPQTLTYINVNREKVISIIEQLKIRQAWKCITHYRLGSKKDQVEILQALFKQINKNNVYFQQYSPIYAAQVLRRNNFDKYYAKIDNAKIFLNNALEYFKARRNIQKIPLEDNIELIKSANDFKIRNDQYLHAVFERFYNDVNIHKRQLYLIAGYIGITLKKKEIERLIEQNFFIGFHSSFSKCFNIFLLFEKQLENPGSHLVKLISKYNENKQKEKVPIYSLHYEYLRKVYPEETKDWEPNQIEKADFCRSLETLNSKNLNSLRQTIEQITQDKFVENVISNNYYYTYRQAAFIFPYQSKYHGENILTKRIISTLTGIEKIVLFNRKQTNTRSAVKYINQSLPNLFTVDEETKIMKKLDHKFEKATVTEEDHEVEAEVEAEVVPEEQKTEQERKI